MMANLGDVKNVEYQNLKDTLLSVVDTGLKFARTVDADAEFELYLFYRSHASVSIKQGIVESTDGIVEGNAVRAAKRNSVSFASASGISVDRIKRSVNEAVSSLKSGSFKDSRFRGFCEPKKPGEEGTFEGEILNLGKDELIEYADNLVKDAQRFDKRILMAESSCASEWGGFAVGNTLGLQRASRSASNSCFISCMAAVDEERRVAYEYDITRERLINTEGLGEKAAQKAISLLGGRKLDATTILRTIWEQVPAAAYILASFARSASGNVVVEGRSPLADKIGKRIANSHLTIVDDGQNPSSLNTTAVDAEGHPQKTNMMIEEGRLSQFMFDNYYAQIFGTESTGNCSRGSGFSGSTLPYETSPTVSYKSIEVKPGRSNIHDLIASIDGQAILISDTPIGIFHSNVSTGEFSAVAQSAFLVQDGETKWPLQPISVSGNFYRGLEHLLEVGSDLKKTPFSVETPSLIFDGFSIVG